MALCGPPDSSLWRRWPCCLSAGLGGVLGRSALATEDRVPAHYKAFTAALAAIESEYAEPVESDRLVYGGINGMLQTLDPHSNFMDPKTYAQMRERQEQRYYGLGITIQSLDRNITVVRVFEGSPAHQKGLRRGDVIAKTGDQDLTGWTTDQAVTKLRGPKGTFVNISVRRPGIAELLPMDVMRDQVTIPSIPAHFLTKGDIGLIRLEDFAEHTDDELGEALDDLRGQGMKRLVLDLRGNPGGQLDQAIRVSNRFLPRGELIVYTRGRVDNSDEDYRATRQSDFLDVPMVVLVNRNSASASEIVVGRAAGPRPRPGRRRDHVRQGARAVGLPRQPGRRPGADHGALLHAQRTPHPASVGRRLRRVPHLHDARPSRRASTPPTR